MMAVAYVRFPLRNLECEGGGVDPVEDGEAGKAEGSVGGASS